jgi:hypothetical protein
MKYLIVENLMDVCGWIHKEFTTEREMDDAFTELRRKSQSGNLQKYIVTEEQLMEEIDKGILSYVNGFPRK